MKITDKMRLDFITRNKRDIRWWGSSGEKPWSIHVAGSGVWRDWADSPRKAIDSAIKAAKRKK